MLKNATRSLVAVSFLACPAAVALADDDGGSRVVDCSRGDSIQRALGRGNRDRLLEIVVRGTCAGDVTITRDDVTLVGDGEVRGTINIIGARRVLIRGLTVSSPTGHGIFGTENAAFRVEGAALERNFMNGVQVRNGAQATIRGGSFSQNGQTTAPDTGRGVEATHNGSIDVQGATISGNRSDGVGVFNGSYARLVQNTIEGNGRQATGEAGVQVNRSRVRANGNVVRNNTGSSAIIVVNHGDYRTGTGLNATDFPNNEFAFEQIEHRVGDGCGVTLPLMLSNCLFAIDVSNASYGDFRQVSITGSLFVGRQSFVQVRGDDILPHQECSQITNTGGVIQVVRNGHLRLVFTNVTNPTLVVGGPGQNAQQEGALTCSVPMQ